MHFYTKIVIRNIPSKICPPKGYRPERSSDLSADYFNILILYFNY